MSGATVTRVLEERLDRAGDPGEALEIVLELEPFDSDAGADLATLRDAFRREAEPVEAAIRAAGGEVVGGTWINRTLLARVPAGRVRGLAAVPRVSAVDLPRAISAETALG